MKLVLCRHLWGNPLPLPEAVVVAKKQGYAAIESPMPAADAEATFLKTIRDAGLSYIAMAFTAGDTVADHVSSFRAQATRAKQLGARHLTAHGGKDAFSASEAQTFYAEVLNIERDLGLPVAHETHRGRIMYSPWTTRPLLEEFADLKLCVDFSHWVCVAERLDWDDAAGTILKRCAEHTLHVHSRVGYAEGPQVPDPSAPEYANELAAHERWWQTVWQTQAAAGRAEMTVTPEFGPPGYLHTLPHTNAPVADLSKVVEFMRGRVAAKFGA
jgi:hypothetical protein